MRRDTAHRRAIEMGIELNQITKEVNMLVTIAVVLGVLWLLGIVVIHIASPLFHILLIVAVIVFIYDLVTRRRGA